MGLTDKKITDQRKTEIISLRCTAVTAKKLKEKSKKLGISVSEFIMDEIEPAIKRKTKRDKNHAKALVETQEAMNQLIYNLSPEQNEIRKQLLDFSERMMNLWQY